MTPNEYQDFCASRAGHQDNTHDERVECFTWGLAGEVGEILDYLKKTKYHGHEYDPKHVLKELGDVAWYLAMLSKECGYTLEEVFEANKAKLLARYPQGFSKAESMLRRDTRAEDKNYADKDCG